MNILYVNWDCLGASDILEAFREIGTTIYEVEISDASHEKVDWDFVNQIGLIIEKCKIDLVFTFNFFPTISEACYKFERIYLAWVYDSPSIKVYHPSIINECNYVFIFDSSVVWELRNKGIKTVYYSPLAVNMKRLDNLKGSSRERDRYCCDVAFVGSLYNEEHQLYERLVEKSNNLYLIGYLEGIMEAQLKVYGYNFLQECLTPEIVKSIYEIMPVEVADGSLTNKEFIYADYFLCRRMACIEREKILKLLAINHRVNHYSNKTEHQLGNVVECGKVDYYDEMPYAFRYAKINLNMTLRSIKTGIPLRAMDILGAGGFLLTNYQEDFLLHFESNNDFVFYGSVEELQDKAIWYLKHEDERQRISKNGREKILKNHTYKNTLEKMLKVVGK